MEFGQERAQQHCSAGQAGSSSGPVEGKSPSPRLSFMLQVEELSRPKDHSRLRFFFGNNPYFHNNVIMKEYHLSIAGRSGLELLGHWARAGGVGGHSGGGGEVRRGTSGGGSQHRAGEAERRAGERTRGSGS